ncbi:MAG: hydrogenase small subunit [Clostridia bacterium]|nr:hydrogenase small subunit [Clostridia bacterium]
MNKEGLSCPDYQSKSQTAKRLLNEIDENIRNGTLTKRNLIWLELTGCSGNIISLIDGTNPDYEYMLTNMVNLLFNNSLMSDWGEEAIEKLMNAPGTDYILAVEGAVATKNNGLYNIIGRWKGKPFTALDAIRLLGEKAAYVIAVGACATHGGVSSAYPNPSQSVSIQSLLKRRVIKLPGCPCHPDWFLGTLAHILLYGEPELDDVDRPILFYGIRIHDRCPRRSFYDQGIFATRLGEQTCMYKLGCRGPVTRTDCPIRLWNKYVNWPVKDDTPCIGCSQIGFPDRMEPFISYNTTRRSE